MDEAAPDLMDLPLTGVRVLSLEQYAAGPYATMFLAQLGAEVIKIEPPKGGDSARANEPWLLGKDDSLFFQNFNLNKRSLTLDLKHPAGREILNRLVKTADAMTNNARGDQPAALGIDYAALGQINPAIVCVHGSAYGRTGPRAAWPGYDYLMQAEAGFMHLTGEPGAPPTRFGLSMVDYMTGSMIAIAALSAMMDARRTGKGRDMDVSLLDTAFHQTSYPALWFLNRGHDIGRAPASAHPSVVPSQLFRTADGWVFIMAQIPKFWDRLTELMGLADLKADPRFCTQADRFANREPLLTIIEGLTLRQPTAHWLELLGGKVPVARVNTLTEALTSPAFAESGMMAEVEHPQGPLKVLASPILVDGERLPVSAAPKLGADTDTLLSELGFSAGDIGALRAAGTV
jgi:crotonobetainyl-CoA:carnitine CoA-transferase CaiB-like acyl-CoA transferase